MRKLLTIVGLAALIRWLWYREDPFVRNVDRLVHMRETYGYRDSFCDR